ncbi:MAG: hypothetical protein MZV63_11385 [Marinilabiliales bacterium]|nr:hypothetical protein [Marinilabiliales bacterium]
MAQEHAQQSNLPLATNNLDEFGYVKFDVPWSLRMAYNFNYSVSGLRTSITQTLTLSGDVRLTPKTAVTYNTGYDFRQNEITMTRVGHLARPPLLGDEFLMDPGRLYEELEFYHQGQGKHASGS